MHAPGGIRTQDLSRWAAAGRSPAEILLVLLMEHVCRPIPWVGLLLGDVDKDSS